MFITIIKTNVCLRMNTVCNNFCKFDIKLPFLMIMRALSNFWTQTPKHFWSKDKNTPNYVLTEFGPKIGFQMEKRSSWRGQSWLEGTILICWTQMWKMWKKIQKITASWFDMISTHYVERNVGPRTFVLKSFLRVGS